MRAFSDRGSHATARPTPAGTRSSHPSKHLSGSASGVRIVATVLALLPRASVRALEMVAATLCNRAQLIADVETVKADALAQAATILCRDLALSAAAAPAPAPDPPERDDRRPPTRPTGPASAGSPERLFARIARRALNGSLAHTVAGATHVHAAAHHPDWAAGRSPVAETAGYLFYYLETPLQNAAPPTAASPQVGDRRQTCSAAEIIA